MKDLSQRLDLYKQALLGITVCTVLGFSGSTAIFGENTTSAEEVKRSTKVTVITSHNGETHRREYTIEGDDLQSSGAVGETLKDFFSSVEIDGLSENLDESLSKILQNIRDENAVSGRNGAAFVMVSEQNDTSFSTQSMTPEQLSKLEEKLGAHLLEQLSGDMELKVRKAIETMGNGEKSFRFEVDVDIDSVAELAESQGDTKNMKLLFKNLDKWDADGSEIMEDESDGVQRKVIVKKYQTGDATTGEMRIVTESSVQRPAGKAADGENRAATADVRVIAQALVIDEEVEADPDAEKDATKRFLKISEFVGDQLETIAHEFIVNVNMDNKSEGEQRPVVIVKKLAKDGGSLEIEEELLRRIEIDASHNGADNAQATAISASRILIFDLDTADEKIWVEKGAKPDAGKQTLPVQQHTLQAGSLSLYPNPNSGRFHLAFTLQDRAPVEVRIVDLLGNEVYRESVRNFTGQYDKDIDISHTSKGTYFLNVRQGASLLQKKIEIK